MCVSIAFGLLRDQSDRYHSDFVSALSAHLFCFVTSFSHHVDRCVRALLIVTGWPLEHACKDARFVFKWMGTDRNSQRVSKHVAHHCRITFVLMLIVIKRLVNICFNSLPCFQFCGYWRWICLEEITTSCIVCEA